MSESLHDEAHAPAAPKPKRAMDERIRVLRTADAMKTMDEAGRACVVAMLDGPAEKIAEARAFHEAVAEVLARVETFSAEGRATLRKLVS